jgi:galactokinase
MNTSEFKGKFKARFGVEPLLFRAPGRVNLIGEHTDYNDGFVMPSAIDMYTWVAVSPRPDRRLDIHSENYSERAEFDLNDPNPTPRKHWSDYPRGVAVILEKAGHRLKGANLMIAGEVPLGSGLSSSAAIEVATALALLGNSGIEVERVALAKLCQRAENEFVGMRCGIMDQFISLCGHAHQTLMLDCRSLEYRLLPLPQELRLVICNTMVKHELASGEYNKRRADCEAAVRHLAKSLPKVKALRDVTLLELGQYGEGLESTVLRRARHVVSEDERVEQAAQALISGDLCAFGKLMEQSHRSLRDDYEVSCMELDTMVELASKAEGVCGARMTGGGFGGCTVNLVRADQVERFKQVVAQGYQRATGLTPQIFVSVAAEGGGQVIA